MKSLLLDIGNSSFKFAFADNSGIGRIYRYFGDRPCEYIKSVYEGTGKVDITVISSVVDMDRPFLDFIHSISERTVHIKECDPMPVKNMYKTPSTLGADRIAAAIGARFLFRKENCIIFDFGTAVTIDFLSRKGEYLGGNISLGLRTRFESLHSHTGKLPLADAPESVSTGIGTSTDEAIKNGIAGGMLLEIEGYLRKYPDYKIIFTGGDAIYFAKELKKPIFVVCNLVLVGLYYMAYTLLNEENT